MHLPESLVETWCADFAATSTGWDFSALAPFMQEPRTPWDFDAMSADALARCDRALDMGTGGGEALSRLVEALRSQGLTGPPVVATEGWPPNVGVAAANLRPYGIPVVVYDSETDQRMPFADDSFSLVLNRHESYCPAELSRVLTPGGVLLTQQVGSLDARETVDWFEQPVRPEWTLDGARAAARNAGLSVASSADFVDVYRFDSVSTLLRYFALVPWDLPDGFTVIDHLRALGDLHRIAESGRPIELTMHRWFFAARRTA